MLHLGLPCSSAEEPTHQTVKKIDSDLIKPVSALADQLVFSIMFHLDSVTHIWGISVPSEWLQSTGWRGQCRN